MHMLMKTPLRCASVCHMYRLDSVDARILLARDDAQEASLIELGGRLGLSRNTIHARLKRLRQQEVLGDPSSTLAPSSIGRPLLAFVTVSVSQQEISSVYEIIAGIPEVVEAHTTTGDADLMLRVVARDTVDLHRITQNIQSAPGVQRSNTSVATTEVIPHRMSALLQQLATQAS